MPPLLQSLELHGYKTFATRTEFLFPGSITAIVGPNGSGKSNIADAIRWVLGEQSFSMLRGRRTEDMIFSGSEQRSRAGMASATITFDNTDGWLPIDFSEVSITRRAYRDGSNEYLLNGQRVRLREIGELLAKSGLAERTYTIIGQGLVDAALALKPEERRKLFEEAAGIGLYRTRREEASNRLINTRRNVERVEDILVELEPRMRSLERQARRAQEYQNLRADLRAILREWYGFHWHRQQFVVRQTLDQYRMQEDRLSQARLVQMAANENLQAKRNQVAELRKKIEGWHDKAASLHIERETASRTVAVLNERDSSLSNLLQILGSELVRREEETNQREVRASEAQAERDRSKVEAHEASEQIIAGKLIIEQKLSVRQQLEREADESRQQLITSESLQLQIKTRQTALAEQKEQHQETIFKLERTIQKDEQEIERSKAALIHAMEQLKNLEESKKVAVLELNNSRKRTSDVQHNLRQIEDQRARSYQALIAVQSQLEALEEAQNKNIGFSDGARQFLRMTSDQNIPGEFQAVSRLISVPNEYEIAIAAALGDWLDLILAQDGADLGNILGFVEENAQSRTALISREWVRVEEFDDLPKDPDQYGIASTLIQYLPSDRKLVEALLGNVLLVKDRVTARRIIPKLPVHFKVVTLAGEVFYASGPVIAGKDQKKGFVQLHRPKEIREQSLELKRAEKKLAEIESQAKQLQSELTQLDAEVRERESQLLKTENSIDSARNEYQKATLTFEQLKRQLSWNSQQLHSFQEQVQAAVVEASEIEKELQEVITQTQVHRQNLQESIRNLSNQSLEEDQANLVHWERSAAVANRAVQEADKRIGEILIYLEDNRRQILSIQKRQSDIESELKTLAEERKENLTSEAQLAHQISNLQALISPAELELNHLEEQLEEEQDHETTARQDLSFAERHTAQALSEYNRQKDSLDTLRQRIEDDFGLVIFDYQPEVTGQDPLPLAGMVESLPDLAELPVGLEDQINRLRGQIRRLGAINPEALTEYQSVKERYQFMTVQVTDLRKAIEDLEKVIVELDELMRREFRKTFEAVAAEFRGMFTRLFGGGNARLILTDDDTPIEAGIDIEARLPGRREQGLTLLSGGERSLAAVALVFALLKVSPTPFCVLDEVDAMLDEANVGRFRELLRELSGNTQFVIITHNRNTVQAADVIYGVTMGRDSTSQVISLKLEEVPEKIA